MPVALVAFALLTAAHSRTVVSGETHKPEHIGQCFITTIKQVTTRLGEDDGRGGFRPIADSGSAAEFADGHYNVSYNALPGVDKSRAGDAVRLCVVKLPSHCPPGDVRGIGYLGTNLRTRLTWKAFDAEHMCGGA